MKNLIATLMFAVLLFSASTAVSAQITNGSFETGSQDPGAFWLSLSAGAPVIDGWSIDSGSIDYIGGWWPAASGTKSIDMSGLTAGQISQTFPTVPGVTYAVSFSMSGNPDGIPIVKQLTVSADGGQAETFSYDISISGNTRSDMKWDSYQYTFVASGEETNLAFTSHALTYFGPVLDNVEVLTGICHRNFGKKGQKTLMVSPHAVPAHINHGDTPGPCEV